MLERSQKKTMKRLEVTKAFEKLRNIMNGTYTDQILTSYFNYPCNYLIGQKPIYSILKVKLWKSMHWVTSKSHFRRLNKDSSVVHEKRWSKWKLRLLWGKAWFFIIVRAWRRNAWLAKPQTIFVGFNGSWRKIPTTFLLGKHNSFWSFIPNKK